MNRKIILGAVVLYVLGAVIHLGLLRHQTGMIWGDAGDGFLCIWILNHPMETLLRGDWNLADGRIFWPDNEGTFFWSDNLIAVSPFFALSRSVMPGMLDAFRITGLFMSILHYGALLFLFHQIYLLVRRHHPMLSPHSAWLVPAFAYLAHFSQAVIINHFMHIQNLSSLGVVALTGSMVAYRRNPGAQWLCVAGISIVFTVYSAPYFAVAGMILIIAWTGLELTANPREILRNAWAATPLLIVPFILAAILAAAYARETADPYLTSNVKELSVSFGNLFTPAFSYSYQLLSGWIEGYPRPHNEKIAWLGPGLLAGVTAVIIYAVLSRKFSLRAWLRSPVFWIACLSLVLLNLKVRELRPYLSWYGVVFVAAAIMVSIYWCSRRYGRHPILLTAAFLVTASVLMYGVAFGPHGYYLNEQVNPSIWGFLSLWVPGLGNMRAVGRLAYIGQVLVMSITALWIWVMATRLRGAHLNALWAAVAVGCVLQGWDGGAARAPIRTYDERLIRPSADEQAFFESIDGSMAVFPAIPFARNTIPMLYFSSFHDLSLMNGYSARTSPAWENIMKLAHNHGAVAPEPVHYALNQGVDYIAVRIEFIYPGHAAWMEDTAESPLFENDRWRVYASCGFERQINNK